MTEASRATGLRFRYGRPTASIEAPATATPEHPVVVIAWATEAEAPVLAGRPVGLGGPVTQIDGRKERYTGGAAWVQSGANLSPGFEPGDSSGSVLLHELGHALGLQHVNAET